MGGGDVHTSAVTLLANVPLVKAGTMISRHVGAWRSLPPLSGGTAGPGGRGLRAGGREVRSPREAPAYAWAGRGGIPPKAAWVTGPHRPVQTLLEKVSCVGRRFCVIGVSF